jgi:hypothetical protein
VKPRRYMITRRFRVEAKPQRYKRRWKSVVGAIISCDDVQALQKSRLPLHAHGVLLGMAKALTRCGLTLKGAHHRGIDDARDIARMLPWIVTTTVTRRPSVESVGRVRFASTQRDGIPVVVTVSRSGGTMGRPAIVHLDAAIWSSSWSRVSSHDPMATIPPDRPIGPAM